MSKFSNCLCGSEPSSSTGLQLSGSGATLDVHTCCCSIDTLHQQPDTANGTVFVLLEDETGVVQVIVWNRLWERQHKQLLESRLLAV